MGWADIWLNTILGIPVRVFWDERKAGHPPQHGRASSNQSKDRLSPVKKNFSSILPLASAAPLVLLGLKSASPHCRLGLASLYNHMG